MKWKRPAASPTESPFRTPSDPVDFAARPAPQRKLVSPERLLRLLNQRLEAYGHCHNCHFVGPIRRLDEPADDAKPRALAHAADRSQGDGALFRHRHVAAREHLIAQQVDPGGPRGRDDGGHADQAETLRRRMACCARRIRMILAPQAAILAAKPPFLRAQPAIPAPQAPILICAPRCSA